MKQIMADPKQIKHNGLELTVGGENGEYLMWVSEYGDERMAMHELSISYDVFNHWEQDQGHLYWHGNYEVWEVYVGRYFPGGVGIQFVQYLKQSGGKNNGKEQEETGIDTSRSNTWLSARHDTHSG